MQGRVSARFESSPRSIEHPAHRNLCIRNLFVKPVIERLFVYRTESCMLTGPNVAIEGASVPVDGLKTNQQSGCGAKSRRARAASVAPEPPVAIPAAPESGGARTLRFHKVSGAGCKTKAGQEAGHSIGLMRHSKLREGSKSPWSKPSDTRTR
jgi:hypothetical protein